LKEGGKKAPSVVPVEVGRWKGEAVESHADSSVLSIFEGNKFPSPGFKGDVELVAHNIGSTYRVTLPGSPENVYYVKHFFMHRRGKGKLRDFIPDQGMRSWKASLAAMAEDIPCPTPVCELSKKTMGIVTASVFICEEIKGGLSENLEMHFRNCFDFPSLTPEQLHEKREIVSLLADLFKSVHDQDSIYFPDFHPHNMVYRRGEAGGELFMVDFDEVRFGLRDDDKLKNLSSLGRNADKIIKKMEHRAITTGDRVRFMERYLGEGASSEDLHKLWKKILDNWNLK